MTSAAIDVEGLHKTYVKEWSRARVEAVRDVSFSVAAGEVFGFIGPNGAGKSTTIRILTGISQATAGRVELFGIAAGNPEARRGLGYVPENPYLYDYLSPLEIMTMALNLHRVVVADKRAHCLAWLERLQLGPVAGKPIRSFSKGMTQRVAIAQALCIRPRLLILDEPLSGLDPIGRRDVVDLLAEYRRSGGTMLFTSHVLHDVERLADRFGLIHRGELRAVRSPAELAGDDETFIVRTVGETALAFLERDPAGRWAAEISRADLWHRLEELRAAGHTLLEVRPRLSLEAAFMRVVGDIDRGAA